MSYEGDNSSSENTIISNQKEIMKRLDAIIFLLELLTDTENTINDIGD